MAGPPQGLRAPNDLAPARRRLAQAIGRRRTGPPASTTLAERMPKSAAFKRRPARTHYGVGICRGARACRCAPTSVTEWSHHLGRSHQAGGAPLTAAAGHDAPRPASRSDTAAAPLTGAPGQRPPFKTDPFHRSSRQMQSSLIPSGCPLLARPPVVTDPAHRSPLRGPGFRVWPSPAAQSLESAVTRTAESARASKLCCNIKCHIPRASSARRPQGKVGVDAPRARPPRASWVRPHTASRRPRVGEERGSEGFLALWARAARTEPLSDGRSRRLALAVRASREGSYKNLVLLIN